MQHPVDVAVAPDGTVYVADRQLPGIWQIKDGAQSVFFQAKAQFKTPLNAVHCLAIDSNGKLLAGCSSTFSVYRFNDAGEPEPIHSGRIGIPMGIAVNKAGDVYVSNIEIKRIVKIPAVEDGSKPEPEIVSEVAAPRGLWMTESDELLIVSAGANQVLKMAADGTMSNVVPGRPMAFPASVVEFNGEVHTCDSFQDLISKVDAEGKLVDFFKGQPLMHPVGMSVHDGKLYIADSKAKCVFVVDADGNINKL